MFDMGSLGRYGKTVERPAKEWLGTFRGRVNEAFGYGAALAERLKRVDPSTIDVLPQAERTAMQGYIAGNIPETRDGWAVLLSAIDKTHPYIHGESGLEDASLHFMMSELFNEALSEAYGENPGSLVALYRGRLAYVLTNPTLAAILIGRHVLDMDDAALSPLIKKAGVNGEKINRSLERIVKDSDCIRKLFREPSDHDDFTADENIPEIAHLDSLREPSEIDFALRSANLYEDRALLYLRAHVEKRSEFIHQHNLSYSWGSFRSDLETALNLYDGVLALEANNKQALEGRGRVGHILSRVFSDDDGGQDGGGSSGGGTSTPSGGQGGSAPADGGGGGATKTLNATSFSALNAIPHTMISSSWTMLGVPPHASFQTSTLSTGMPLWNAQLAGNVSTAMSTTPVFRGGTFHI